jgi:hypothetical protein
MRGAILHRTPQMPHAPPGGGISREIKFYGPIQTAIMLNRPHRWLVDTPAARRKCALLYSNLPKNHHFVCQLACQRLTSRLRGHPMGCLDEVREPRIGEGIALELQTKHTRPSPIRPECQFGFLAPPRFASRAHRSVGYDSFGRSACAKMRAIGSVR